MTGFLSVIPQSSTDNLSIKTHLLREHYRPVHTNALIAGESLAGTAHTRAETAAHPLFKGKLPVFAKGVYRTEHWHRAAGKVIVKIRAFQSVGYKAFQAETAVCCGDNNRQAKSLKFFVSNNELPFGVRTSMSDYRKQDKLINLPLYAISQLWEVCDAFN